MSIITHESMKKQLRKIDERYYPKQFEYECCGCKKKLISLTNPHPFLRTGFALVVCSDCIPDDFMPGSVLQRVKATAFYDTNTVWPENPDHLPAQRKDLSLLWQKGEER